ncbi:nonribosomal peptide synthase [Patellaria atrata CBS 101060]|uniref:Nonribosomal peptide synthase n=1 Tax=Patellaria atrata CBS 101060 TaxID=1346257 RepID=A0A9P4S5P2_9PEZI|nr:nonribosomal peptide synthase [Patellaria atrata CBS 101060]
MAAYVKHISTKDIQGAQNYWKKLFPEGEEPSSLYSFPQVHQSPRVETVVTACDELLGEMLEFMETFDMRAHDLLYAAWAIVADRHRLNGQRNACFVVESRDRTFFKHESVIGLVDQKFPLMLSIPDNTDTLAWIGHVRDVTAEASCNAFIGYKQILEAANYKQPQIKVSIGFTDDGYDVMTDDDDFALVLNISIATQLKFSLRHNSSVPACDAQALMKHFVAALEYMVENPKCRISDIQMFLPSETDFILQSGKAAFKPQRGLLHNLIEQQARLTPDLSAVQFESDEPLSYSTFNKRANQLARQIRQHRGLVVPVLMRTTSELILTLLAILKAGAAYVILDPEAPADRNRLIIKTVEATHILVDNSTAGLFENETPIEDLLELSKHNDGSDLALDQEPTDSAYIIFTSGSTGKPKAAVLDHNAAFNGLVAFPKSHDRRQLLFFNPVFSAAQRSIWAPLCTGGCLCLASKKNLTVHTAETIASMNINSIEMTSTTAFLISPETTPSLRRLALGGEMPSPALVEMWGLRVELLSSYGLSECTQLNARRRLVNASQARFLGQAFDTTTTYILTPETTNLSPLLIPGELCFGGSQLAKEYLNNSEETKKRFIKNPFGRGRLYRTGDLAVRHADGSIEMIGRIDYQVKINGQKVDPAEPNAIIQSHKEVEQSAVVSTVVGKKTVLVAMIVSRAGSDWNSIVDELRSAIGDKLPLYMVPSFWVPASSLPLNLNQKVDIAAIRKKVESLALYGRLLPPGSRGEANEDDLNDNERIVRKVWSEFLPVQESDILLEDSFIALGGSSLEAVQIASKLHSEYSLTLRVEDVILGGSLAQVAALIQVKPHEEFESNVGIGPFGLMQENFHVEDLGLKSSDIEDVFPVTPFQEGVITNAVMGGVDFIYRRAYSFKGHSVSSVKEALQTLIKTQPLLRTTFVAHGHSYLQVVKKSVDVPWEVVNKNLKVYLKQDPESMAFGGLWWKVITLPEDILVITVHHALFDYWSNAFIPQDITSILTGGKPIQRTPFNRYVQYLHRQDQEAMHDFWQSYLAGAIPSRLGSRMAPENTVTARVEVDLKSTASKLKVTPAVLLYTAWAIVLADSSSNDDIIFGITLSGRDAPVSGIMQMAGPALTMAPLRIIINRELSLESIAAHVQATLWKVTRHALYGMRNILKASKQPRDIFDTAVNFLIKAPQTQQAGGLVILPEASLERNENVKVELNNGSLNEVVLSSTLQSSVSQNLVNSVARVLESFGRNDELSSTGITVSVAQESGKGFFEPPESVLTYEMVHVEIQRMAVVYPSNIAIQEASGNSITYAGLSIKANQLATLLRKKGVRAEQVVPVMLDKSINTAVVMLGVMISGGAFVTLDGKNPRERNSGIIEDVGAKISITDKANSKFFEGVDYEVIVIEDVQWHSIPIQRCLAPEVTPESLVYIVYTSGSTGKPKGTLLPHEGLAAATQGIVESTNVTASWRCLWALNYVFDGSFHAFFAVLSVGGTLCMAPQDAMVANLGSLINSMKATEASITPTMASLLSPEEIPTLKVLCIGGEPVPPFIPDIWARAMTVYSLYGPTEATICVTGITVTPEHNLRNIGRAFKTVTAAILDPETMEQIPHGDVGELCVGGPQIARGYLNRPEATAKVFHTQADGTRIYQTGDLARWLPNGEIELFGRKDDQIKLNGYRIELGEVESVIMQTNDFSQCAVVVGTVMKKKQLVAFCLGSSTSQTANETSLLLPPEEAPDWKAVAEKLTTLSSYMIPTVWFPVSKMPLSVSGKANKKELLAFVENMDESLLKEYLGEAEVVEISTGPERVLQNLWASTLNVPLEEIHANSTFHGIGGDSISAINLTSTARRHGYQITVSEILSNPSLREQTPFLKKNFQGEMESVLSAEPIVYEPPSEVYARLSELNIFKKDVEDIYPCTAGQIEFLSQGIKKDQFWQLHTVRRLPAGFDFDRWIYLTTKLTKNNQILRALYLYLEENNPLTAIQVVLKHPVLNLTYRSYSSEEERQQILDADWEATFEAGKPFVRYMLLEHSEDGTRDLVIKLDHASYDGSLLYIFDDQFVALNHNLPLPQQTPFKDFINYISTTKKQPQLDYWKDVLGGYKFDFLSTTLEPKISSGLSGKIDVEVGLDDLAEVAGVTAPIVFQTAFSLLLAHLSRSRDVMYDNLISGRNVPIDNPQLITGTCANFLPFRSQISTDTSVKAILSQTQADFWESSENGLVSLGEIYQALGRNRSEGSKCLFCFQPFEPSSGEPDPMRWIVMKMNKNKMYFNYAIQLEIRKTATKGEYVAQFTFDERAITKSKAQEALDWYKNCLGEMAKSPEAFVKI